MSKLCPLTLNSAGSSCSFHACLEPASFAANIRILLEGGGSGSRITLNLLSDSLETCSEISLAPQLASSGTFSSHLSNGKKDSCHSSAAPVM